MSAMPPRFFAPDLTADHDTVALRDEEATHLERVLRLGVGDVVRVFDGRGLEREALVASIVKREVSLHVGRRVEAARELSFPLTLAQSVLKGDAFDAIVRDATMLGATAIQPVVAARCEVSMAALQRGRRVERWRRIAISSTKQCRRAVVPDILDPVAFQAVWAASPPSQSSGGSGIASNARMRTETRGAVPIMLVEPAAVAANAGISAPQAIEPNSGVLVLVGPEGGWTDGEIADAATAGARFVTLGDRTLRAEAAALVALPVLLYAWGEL